MLVGLSSKRVTTTMVTLITEKLQNQSLDDLACKAYSINLHSPESLNQSDTLFPFEIHEDRPWRVVGNGCQIRKEATSTKATAFHFPICQYNYGGTDNIGLQWQKDTTTPSSIVSWTLKNSKSLCSLDYEEDDDIDDPHMKTIVSSPCDSNDLLMNIITPGSSPMKESVTHHHNCHSTTGHVRSFGSAATVSESEEDTSDCDSTDDGIFPLDCGDLDLEQIENN
ncbi:protein FAM53A-like isoform X2 [Polypterus senegalus]|nr:protein FAM53A-like isoform X2 [Polypterus senegalus]